VTDQKSRIFINSLPKSGTHLLAKTAELFGYREHFDPKNLDDPERVTPIFFNYREVKGALAQQNGSAHSPSAEEAIYVGTLTPVYARVQDFRRWFEALAPGRYVLGHVGYAPGLGPLLRECGVAHLFIIRDPQAVLASLLSFILDTRGMPRPHFLEADFRQMSPAQRLDLLLEGGHAPIADVHVTPFAQVYQTMLGWQRDPDCLVVTFEDLVGPQGGGTVERQMATGEKIAKHLGIPFDSIAQRLGEIYSPASRTFREGQVNGWQDALDAASLDKLRRYCEPLLQLTSR
jgi:hypothetical protein